MSCGSAPYMQRAAACSAAYARKEKRPKTLEKKPRKKKMITIAGVPFVGKRCEGDFEHTMRQPEYAKTVFVFNDNVVDAVKQPRNGAGSAIIRTHSLRYKPDERPRAIGIPTGWSVEFGGFKLKGGSLEPFARRAITLAIERLVIACTTFRSEVDCIVFSSTKDRKTLGCNIFRARDPHLYHGEAGRGARSRRE